MWNSQPLRKTGFRSLLASALLVIRIFSGSYSSLPSCRSAITPSSIHSTNGAATSKFEHAGSPPLARADEVAHVAGRPRQQRRRHPVVLHLLDREQPRHFAVGAGGQHALVADEQAAIGRREAQRSPSDAFSASNSSQLKPGRANGTRCRAAPPNLRAAARRSASRARSAGRAAAGTAAPPPGRRDRPAAR